MTDRTHRELDAALDHVAERHRQLTDARNAMAFTPGPGDAIAIEAALLSLEGAACTAIAACKVWRLAGSPRAPRNGTPWIQRLFRRFR